MGLIGRFSSLWRGTPKAPPARPYERDPYWGVKGPGTTLGQAAHKLAIEKAMEYANRAPGFTAEEQEAMFAQPAEEMKLRERNILRDQTQADVGGGRFGSGRSATRRGVVRATTSNALGSLRQQVKIAAAQAALEDRMRQLAALSGVWQPTLGFTAGEKAGANQYGMGLNQLDLERWRTQLGQYNKDFDWSWNRVQDIARAVSGGGGFAGQG